MGIFPEGGGGGASFSQLVNHVAAGTNIATSWSATTQILTINATGFTGNNIAGATDVTINAVVDGQILVRSGNVFRNQTVSGDLTTSTNGSFTINANAVTTTKLADDSVTSDKLAENAVAIRLASDVTVESVTAGHLLIWNGTVWHNQSVAGDITISQSGTVNIAANTIGPTELIVSGNGNAGQHLTSGGDGTLSWTDPPSGGGGSTTFSGLTDTDIDSLQSGDVVIWNGTERKWINYGFTGDVLVNDTGVTTIGGSRVTSSKIASNAITPRELNVTGSGSNGQVLTSDGDGSFSWTNKGSGGGGGGLTTSNLLEGNGVTIAKSGDNATFSSNAGKTKRFIDFGNDTTTDIEAGTFVAGLDGFDANGNFIGESANDESKVPIGIAVVPVSGKESNGSDANVVKRSVFVDGSHNVPSGDIDGSLSGATDRQAVYLKWVSTQWKVTLEKTKWLVGTHHNGDVIFNFTGMHSSQDFADQLVSTISAFSGDIDRTNDGIIVDDNGVAKNVDWDTFEAVTEPIHLKTNLQLSGYRFNTNSGSLTAGQFHLVATDLSNVTLRGISRSGDEEQFKSLMSIGFRLRIQNAANTVYVEGIVGTFALVSGALQVHFVNNSVVKSSTDFSNDDNLTFVSKGRHPSWPDVEFDRTGTPDHKKLASTGYVNDYVTDHFGRKTVTGFTALAGGSTPSANKQVVWSSTDNDFEFYLTDATYNSISDLLQAGHWLEFYSTTSYLVFERCQISSVGNRVNNLVSVVVSNQWIRNNAHQGAQTGVGIRFIGNRRYEMEDHTNKKRQYCAAKLARGEGTSLTSNTRFNTTFTPSGSNARVGRVGTAMSNSFRNDTFLNNSNDEYIGFRAFAGNAYAVAISLGATFSYGNQGSTQFGVEMGLQYRHKLATSSTWSSWNVCDGNDDGSGSNLIYDSSSLGLQDNGGNTTFFGADSVSGNNRFLSLFRGKSGNGAQTFIDAAFPAIIMFNVGDGDGNAFRTQNVDRDFEFWIAYVATGGVRIEHVYNLTCNLTAIRVA